MSPHRPTRLRRTGAGVLALALTGLLTLSHPGASVARSASKATPATSYAVGRNVYLGPHGGTKVHLPQIAQSLYYTSAGLLVRTNRNGFSDGGAPFHFELVNAHGRATKLGVTLGDVVPSTDPRQPCSRGRG